MYHFVLFTLYILSTLSSIFAPRYQLCQTLCVCVTTNSELIIFNMVTFTLLFAAHNTSPVPSSFMATDTDLHNNDVRGEITWCFFLDLPLCLCEWGEEVRSQNDTGI